MITVTPANEHYTRSYQDCDEKQALLSDLHPHARDYLSHKECYGTILGRLDDGILQDSQHALEHPTQSRECTPLPGKAVSAPAHHSSSLTRIGRHGRPQEPSHGN